MIFLKNEETNNDNYGTISPAVSTKTVNSYKTPHKRQESASEGENAHRKKHG